MVVAGSTPRQVAWGASRVNELSVGELLVEKREVRYGGGGGGGGPIGTTATHTVASFG